MNEKIALAFHTCVDYELVWDTQVIEKQIKEFDIHADELKMDIDVNSERDVWLVSLANLQAGIGCEIIPKRSVICEEFAERFKYEVTLGGTSTRAGIILAGMGYQSVLQTSCYNRYVKELMPKEINVLPGRKIEGSQIYPHVVLQCSGGARICANDIDFITPRENRILISRDEDSLNMPVLVEEFGEMIRDAEVLLLGSYTQIMDYEILKDIVHKTKKVLDYLNKDTIVVMEDGCYIKSDFRKYVHRELGSIVDVLSMNEDELQQYVGKKIDLLNPEMVIEAIETVRKNVKTKHVLIHSAEWALVYGDESEAMKESLVGGIAMASTRFRIGDGFTVEDYEKSKEIVNKEKSIIFSEKVKELMGDNICCVPCKDLSYVESPTVVGLGDTFIGGVLPGLLKKIEKLD